MPTADRDRTTAAKAWRPGLGAFLIAALGSLAFAFSLLATLPARIVASYAALPGEINGFSGTVWRGAAQLPGAHRVVWRFDGGASLAALGPAFAVEVTGAGTELEGWVLPRGLTAHAVRIDDLGGQLAWPLIASLAPVPEVVCDLAAEVDGISLHLAPGRRSGTGGFAAGPGRCHGLTGEPVEVPPLEGRVETRDASLALVLAGEAAPEVPLAEAALTSDDRLLLTLHAEGAALVPGAPQGEVTLEYPLVGLPF